MYVPYDSDLKASLGQEAVRLALNVNGSRTLTDADDNVNVDAMIDFGPLPGLRCAQRMPGGTRERTDE